MIQLFNGDSIKIMQNLIDEGVKVDCIITDIPYCLLEGGKTIHLFRQSAQHGSTNITEDQMSFDKAFDQTSWLKKAMKLLKQGGSIIIFNDWKKMTPLVEALEKGGIKVKSLNHWAKLNALPSEWRRRFVSGREYFIYGTKKGANHTFNVDYVHNGDIRIGLTPKGEKKHGGHPNMKPLALMSELIKILTNPGDTVLDPFMGSGSTIIAAQKLGRNSIGIELDLEFYELAKRRIDDIENINIKDYDHSKVYNRN